VMRTCVTAQLVAGIKREMRSWRVCWPIGCRDSRCATRAVSCRPQKVSRTFNSSPFGGSRNTRSRGTERRSTLIGVSAWAACDSGIVGRFKTGFLVQALSGRIKDPTALLLRRKPCPSWLTSRFADWRRRILVKDVRHSTQFWTLGGPGEGHW
jgi:hypothetical protein